MDDCTESTHGIFTCTICKGVFEKERSDEEAMSEAHTLFGHDTKQEDCALVCDDCFNKIHPQRN